VRYGDVYVSSWKLESEPLQFDEIRASAFDNPMNAAAWPPFSNNTTMYAAIFPRWDAQFAQLARERTHRHPLRTYVWIPFARSFVLWLTPRIELLPYSGKLWPLGEMHRDEPDDFDATVELGVLGFLYAALGIAASCGCCDTPAISFRLYPRNRSGLRLSWPCLVLYAPDIW